MALFSSYLTNYGDGSGKTKEFKLDKITLAVQAQTPTLDMCSRAKVTNQHFIWLEETLSTGQTNAQNEGVDFATLSDDHKSAPTIASRDGYAQLFAKGIEVTDQQEMSAKASVTGTNSEMKDQLYAKSIEIKTDIEAAMMGQASGNAGSGTSSNGSVTGARVLTSYFSQLASDVQISNRQSGDTADQPFNLGNAVPGPASSTQRGGTIYKVDQLTVELFNNGGLNWDGGNGLVKDANLITMSPQHKHYWDLALDRRPNVRRDVGADGMMYGIRYTMYKSSYGDFKVMPNTYQQNTEIAVFNPQNWAVAVYKDVYTKDIASVGLSERKMMAASLGLIHRHQSISGAITQIAPTGTATTDPTP